jgi:hypothetical protein
MREKTLGDAPHGDSKRNIGTKENLRVIRSALQAFAEG